MKTFFHIIGVFCAAAACSLFLSASANAIAVLAHSPVQKSNGSVPKSNGSVQKGKASAKKSQNSPLEKVVKQNSQDKAVRKENPGHSTPVTMYMQNDPAWADFLYGGQDPMASYGCGPTALAIAAATLSKTSVTPVDTAKWAAGHGYYSPQNGSVHALIPDGAKNYGLTVEKLDQLTPEAFCLALSMDKLLVLLMGPGDFSDSGHFIIAYGYDGNGNILVADPASNERSSIHWPASTLISQLLMTAKNGGPVWALSKP